MKDMRKIYTIIICVFTCLLFFHRSAFAATVALPDMLHGQTEVDINGQTYYGGLGGNFAVYNTDNGQAYGFDSSKLGLSGCQTSSVTSPCFVLGNVLNANFNTINVSGRLLTSDTYATDLSGNKTLILETPVLFLGNRSIQGDAAVGSPETFGSGGFTFWGKNLAESNGSVDSSTGATWNLGNYTVNNNSQSQLFGSGGTEFNAYLNKITALQNNGTVTTNANSSVLFLQTGPSSDINSNSGLDKTDYPEGRVWVVNGNLDINNDIQYSGIGTIIVTGNVRVHSGHSIKAVGDDTNNNHLGIITTSGMCVFDGNNTIEGMFLCKQFSTVKNGQGNNYLFQGSFVADQTWLGSSANIRYVYDFVNEGSMPPGFRDLNLPTSAEIGNATP